MITNMVFNISKMKNIVNSLLCFYLFMSFLGCPSREVPRCEVGNDNTYKFQLNASVYPVKEIYQVGDTLGAIISFAEAVFDLTTEENYPLPREYTYLLNSLVRIADSIPSDNIGFRMDSIVTVLDLPNLASQYNSFLDGSSDGTTTLLSEFSLDQETSTYSIEYRLLLNEPGVYVLENRSNIGDVDLFGELEIDGFCNSASITSVITLSGEAQSNFNLLEETSVPLFINTLIDRRVTRFDEFGSFVFKVE